jgi:hypothetical protein
MSDNENRWVSKHDIRAKFRGKTTTLDNALHALRERKIILASIAALLFGSGSTRLTLVRFRHSSRQHPRMERQRPNKSIQPTALRAAGNAQR